MSILSIAFIIFLIVFIGIYFIVPKKFQWIILLIGNFVYYAINSYKCLYYILITIISQYLIARILDNKNQEYEALVLKGNLSGKEKTQLKEAFAKKKKKYLLLSIFINLGLMIFVKYTNIIIDEIGKITVLFSGGTPEHLDIITPLGLSYYTFASIGYVIDVYRDKQKAEKSIFKFALFVSFFPTIMMGPIHRYKDLADQLSEEHSFDYYRLCFGVQRMIWGYIKKLVIAERVSVVVNTVYNNYSGGEYLGFLVIVATFLYGFEIYTDFSGGMDIVIGIGEVLGISMTENFQRPYMSRTYSEFWRRWHISLGAWFRNYVFYPLSLSKPFNKLSKKCRKIFGEKTAKVIPPSIASFITFLLIGIWHGTGWKYVVYGLYQAIMVAQGALLEDFYERMRKMFHINTERFGFKLFQILRTNLLIIISRYFSRSENLKQVVCMFKNTFAEFNPWVFFDGTFYNLGLDEKNFRFMLFSILILGIVDIIQERGIHIRETIARQNIVVRWTIYYAALFTIIIFGMYGPGYDASSFVYMKF